MQRFVEPLAVDGFKDVVHRVGGERLDGVVVVGGDEHDRGHPVDADAAHDFQAVEARHLDVEEHQVRRHGGDRGHRVRAVTAFADDGQLAIGGQQRPQSSARQWFVIDDEDA